MLTLMLVCAFSPRKYKSILRGFYDMVPFQEIATASPLAMPRNDRVLRTEKKKFCLLAKNGVIDLRFLFYPVQRGFICRCVCRKV